MPTYEYICESCNYSFEKFQSIKSKPIKKCPKCSKNTVKRLIGAGSGIIFKGSGFYATDYREKKQPSNSLKPGEVVSSDKGKTIKKGPAKKTEGEK